MIIAGIYSPASSMGEEFNFFSLQATQGYQMKKNRHYVNYWRILFRTYNQRKLLLIFLWIIGPSPLIISQEYFQQEVNYTIHVSLNDKRHELDAFETIEYINNSPDSLQFLFFHLWPNGYSGNNTELAKQLFSLEGKKKLFNDPELRGYIDSLDFRVDDQQVKWNLLPGLPDICQIILNKAVKSGETIYITTPFHVKIPNGVTSRLGHIGESYQISQWYPKPAVYDRKGWHPMPYLDQGEFYSEFGSFDVSITLPANYIVGATGNLQNEQEVEMLDKHAADTSWKKTYADGGTEFPTSSEQMKTIRFTENQIHDFAWFADKRFHVLKGKVILPESGREVTTWVMFTNQQAGLWKDALSYVNNALWHFSNWIGDYPYNSFTVVQSALNAGTGMEYPGITVIGLTDDAYSLDAVIAHETCHSWFYSALGSDERQYPFMDEGITSAYEVRYLNERYPGKKLWEVYYRNRKLAKFFHIDEMPVMWMQELEWLVQARRNLDQPVNLPAPVYSILNYNPIIYYKAALGFNYLRAYLGDSLFDLTMHAYYRTWKFMHPQPDDLQMLFESFTNKDLSWFFCDFIGTTKRMDYKVLRFENQELLVKNKGELVSPLVISCMNGDSIHSEQWVDGFEGRRWIDIPKGNYSEIKIDPMHLMPELYRINNNTRKSGIFAKFDPIQPRLFFTIDEPDKHSVMYFPAIDWNKEDGFMLGVTFQNKFQLPKPIEYLFMPFYSFKKSGIAGYGKVTYNILPYANFIRLATITLEGAHFGAPANQNYHKVKGGFDLYFRAIKMNKLLNQKVFGYYYLASDLMQIEELQKTKMLSYMQFGYRLERSSIINPFTLLPSIESNKSYQKASVELNYRYSYYGKRKGLDIRLFAGTMLKTDANTPFYSLAASGRSGRELYLFQDYYPDRFGEFPNSFWSRQMSLSEGSLVSPVNDSLGYCSWLISVSLTSSLPGKAGRIPVKPFVNFLLSPQGSEMNHNLSFFYEAGLKAGIWNFLEIYFPILVSGNIQSIDGSFKNRVRIVLKLNSFNQLLSNTRVL